MMSSSPEDLTGDSIRVQLGPVYEELAAEEWDEYRALLDQITSLDDVGLSWKRQVGGRWKIAITASDRPGVLSVIAGLMTAHRIEVVRGDLCSVRLSPSRQQPSTTRLARGRFRSPRPTGPVHVSRKILDIFEAEASHIKGDAFWAAFRDELAGLIKLVVRGQMEKAREEISDRVSTALRHIPPTQDRLLPVSISFDNQSATELTGVHVVSSDTPGFLFAFSNALTMLGTDIVQVQVRTLNDEVRDTFWISDRQGRKIVDERKLHELRLAVAPIKQFTHVLPSAPNPSQALQQFEAMVSDLINDPELADDFERLQSTPVLRTFAEMMGVSQFLWEDFLRMQHQNLFPVVSDTSTLREERDKSELERCLRDALGECGDDERKTAILNRFKDREMFASTFGTSREPPETLLFPKNSAIWLRWLWPSPSSCATAD